jgi:hypothetical protein
VVGDADDVAGEGFVRNLSLAGEKEDGAVDGERDARANMAKPPFLPPLSCQV